MTDLIQALTQQNNSYEKGNFKHGSLRGLQTSALKGEKRISYWHWALELLLRSEVTTKQVLFIKSKKFAQLFSWKWGLSILLKHGKDLSPQKYHFPFLFCSNDLWFLSLF